MKNSFAFFLGWFPTLIIASLLSGFGSGFLQMFARILLPDLYRLQSFAVYTVLTVIICAALAVVSAKLGYEMNGRPKRISAGIPVLNMAFGGIVYSVLYVLMKGRALGVLWLFPCEMFLVNGVLGEKGTDTASMTEKTGLCIVHFIVYVIVSVIAYVIAKKKREKAEGAQKPCGEKKKPNNRFGIDVDI